MSRKSKDKVYATSVEDKNHNHQAAAWASAAHSLPYTKFKYLLKKTVTEGNRELGASSSGNRT